LDLLAAKLEINPRHFLLIQNENAESVRLKAGQPNKYILHIGIALIVILLGAAYLSQSPTFPETTFELFLFWAAIIQLYLIVILKKLRY
jgi:hypothetical protein